MPIDYRLEGGYVRATWRGQVSADDVSAYWNRMFRDPAAYALGRSLTDARGSEPLVTGQELNDLVQMVAVPLLRGKRWRNALLVDQPVQYGIGRQFAVFAEAITAAELFYDEAAAIAWLTDDPTSSAR